MRALRHENELRQEAGMRSISLATLRRPAALVAVAATAVFFVMLAWYASATEIAVYHQVVVRPAQPVASRESVLLAFAQQKGVLRQHLSVEEADDGKNYTIRFLATRTLLRPGLAFDLERLCKELRLHIVQVDHPR